MAEPKAKTGKVLPQEMVTTVKDFYSNNEYSRMCVGKKEYVNEVKDKKEKLQKRLLLLSIREFCLEFKKLNPNVKSELQTKQVVNVNSSGMCKVCVYEHHQIVKFFTMSLPLKSYYKDILKEVVCDINSRNCMSHVCENCPELDDGRNFITNCFDENNIDTDKDIT